MLAKIEFEKPPGADVSDVAAFIADALTSMGGCLRPDDPMFNSLTLKRLIVHGKEFDVSEDQT